MKHVVALITALTLLSFPVFAGEADILSVDVQKGIDNTYRFSVTVKHTDTGWDHYANAFDVISPDGRILGTRKLLHPHVNEQPFIRSLSGVRIPADLTSVIIRAHDSVHGFGGKEIAVPLKP
ncbi:MAG: hypothetical protein OQK24_01950 [Magnetovibrio sp.]|nr:hypothetical protein [Magnetovibrio sp.]